MHQIYTTEGIVLAKRPAGEANTLVALLTHELGLVRVAARSARSERSKLRYGLEPLTQARFALVRGKREWKLTGALNVSRAWAQAPTARRAQLGKVSLLLLRLIRGEEGAPELFATVAQGFGALAQAQEPGEAESIECVLVLRILAHLGYLPHTPELAPFLGAPDGELRAPELMAQAQRSRALLVRAINESLSASGL